MTARDGRLTFEVRMLTAERRTRVSQFSYTCNRCRRCCHHKRIRVNPYEVVRLARNRGVSTTELLSRYTTAGGTELRTTPTGACVFLTEAGCGVHGDRPLVCRLYPLGRHVDGAGRETFSELTPHPETAGIYGADGTVDDYLRAQGVAPFTAAADRYLALLDRLTNTLTAAVDGAPAAEAEVRTAIDETAAGVAADVPPWLDADRVVAAWCRQRGLPPPTTAEESMALHIDALDAWQLTLTNGEHE